MSAEKQPQEDILDRAAEELKREDAVTCDLSEADLRDVIARSFEGAPGVDRLEVETIIKYGGATVILKIKMGSVVMKIGFWIGNGGPVKSLRFQRIGMRDETNTISPDAQKQIEHIFFKRLENGPLIEDALRTQLAERGARMSRAEFSFEKEGLLSARLIREPEPERTDDTPARTPEAAPDAGEEKEETGDTQEKAQTPGKRMSSFLGRMREKAREKFKKILKPREESAPAAPEPRKEGSAKAAIGAFLANRSQEIQRGAERLGRGTGKAVHNVGRWYNSLPREAKIVASGILIGGSLVFGAGSLFVALPALARGAIAGAGVYAGVYTFLLESRGTESRWLRWATEHPALVASVAGIAAAVPALGKFVRGATEVHTLASVPVKPATGAFDALRHAAPSAPAVPPSEATVAATVAHRGDGYERLIGHLKGKLSCAYPDSSKAPPGIRSFLKANIHRLAIKDGFYDPKTGVSKIVRLGASLSINGAGKIEYVALPDAA